MLCKSLPLIHTQNHPVGIAKLANNDDDDDGYDDKSKNNGDRGRSHRVCHQM
jgi:hypothetical protein